MASLPHADIRAGAEDWGNPPIRIGLCPSVHGQPNRNVERFVVQPSPLHAQDCKGFWETLRSRMSDTVAARRSRSVEAIC